jgi:endonuclease/exonuclease/phosphatase family metal-dependent hydrolase
MSVNVRIATFNCENLFARYKFKQNANVSQLVQDGWKIDQTKFQPHDPVKRRITGRAIKGAKADIVALQEVEDLDVVKRFRSKYLGGFKAFPHVAIIDGNDPRLIDVGIISRYPIVHLRSYHHLKKSPQSRSYIFSRDCLEVDIDVDGNLITLFINHLKSMMGGRSKTKERRQLQSKTVKQIVIDRFGSQAGSAPFIILGDLNDYMGTGSGITDIVNWNQVENVVKGLPADEQWTHYYNKKKEYRQLDYILVSKALESKVKNVEIERRGMPLRAAKYTGTRFPGVGQDNPKASDHCPVVVELEL